MKLLDVLIIEDQGPAVQMLRSAVAQIEGLHLIGDVATCDEAVQKVGNQDSPKLVLLDVFLGKKQNGIQIMDYLYGCLGLAVFALTISGHAGKIDKKELDKQPWNLGFLDKPVTEQKLVKNITMAAEEVRRRTAVNENLTKSDSGALTLADSEELTNWREQVAIARIFSDKAASFLLWAVKAGLVHSSKDFDTAIYPAQTWSDVLGKLTSTSLVTNHKGTLHITQRGAEALDRFLPEAREVTAGITR